MSLPDRSEAEALLRLRPVDSIVQKGHRFEYASRHLANTRMHRSLTLGRRRDVFHASLGLLRRHYGYVPFSWVFGYAALGIDGRYQFFEPLRVDGEISAKPYGWVSGLSDRGL
jgi:hypothetical protein